MWWRLHQSTVSRDSDADLPAAGVQQPQAATQRSTWGILWTSQGCLQAPAEMLWGIAMRSSHSRSHCQPQNRSEAGQKVRGVKSSTGLLCFTVPCVALPHFGSSEVMLTYVRTPHSPALDGVTPVFSREWLLLVHAYCKLTQACCHVPMQATHHDASCRQ